MEASRRGITVEGKLALPAPLKVHLAPAETVVISEAQTFSGDSSNTADTLETGQQPCSSLRHIRRMLHPRVPKSVGTITENFSRKRMWASHSIPRHGTKIAHPGPRSRGQPCSMISQHQDLHTMLAPLPPPAWISKNG